MLTKAERRRLIIALALFTAGVLAGHWAAYRDYQEALWSRRQEPGAQAHVGPPRELAPNVLPVLLSPGWVPADVRYRGQQFVALDLSGGRLRLLGERMGACLPLDGIVLYVESQDGGHTDHNLAVNAGGLQPAAHQRPELSAY